MPYLVCGGHRTTCRHQFSPSMWIPEVKVRSSDFVASTITDWAILLASEFKSFNNKPKKLFYPNLAFMLFSFWMELILNFLNGSCVSPYSFLLWSAQSIFELDSWFLQIYSILILIFWLYSVYSIFIICLCKIWSHTRQYVGHHF